MNIREYRAEDSGGVQEVYQRAFAGLPWYEQLSDEEVARRWLACSTRRGFFCLVAEAVGQVIGFTCFDTPTLPELEQERGEALAKFTSASGQERVVWIRETCVTPEFQGKSLARVLKEAAWSKLCDDKKSAIVLTRMRDDNTRIIHLNETLGFRRTGIRLPDGLIPSVFQEYWYRRGEGHEKNPVRGVRRHSVTTHPLGESVPLGEIAAARVFRGLATQVCELHEENFSSL